MKILIKENQYKRLLETVTNNEVICDKCGWSWDLSEGGDDPYICHECGHTNEEKIYGCYGEEIYLVIREQLMNYKTIDNKTINFLSLLGIFAKIN